MTYRRNTCVPRPILFDTQTCLHIGLSLVRGTTPNSSRKPNIQPLDVQKTDFQILIISHQTHGHLLHLNIFDLPFGQIFYLFLQSQKWLRKGLISSPPHPKDNIINFCNRKKNCPFAKHFQKKDVQKPNFTLIYLLYKINIYTSRLGALNYYFNCYFCVDVF